MLNPSIILAGQQPDIVGALRQGTEAGALANAAQTQNALSSLYAQQGADIVAGKPQAINALAALDPYGAQDIVNTQQTMQVRQQQETRLAEADRRAIAERAAALDAETAAKEAEDAAEDLRVMALATNEQEWDQNAIARGMPELQGKFSQARIILAQSEEALSAHIEAIKPKDPADEYGRYVAEEQAAGRVPLSRLDYKRAGSPKSVIRSLPGGGTEVIMGVGAEENTAGKPSDPLAMVASIDGILTDPAIDFATGWKAWTQKIPGTEAKRFEGRAKQLEGQAFLKAFDDLRGAGQITEIEGAKAQQAVGRLDTAQRPEDYRAALLDLRKDLLLAASRPPGWANTPEGQAERQKQLAELSNPPAGYAPQGAPPPVPAAPPPAADISDEELMQQLLEGN